MSNSTNCLMKALLLGAFGVSQCVPAAFAAQDHEPIKLGITNAISGPIASACKPVSDGALAWFKHVNAAGGIHGRKIDAIVMDDAYTATQALANTREFVRDKVVAMFSGCGSIQPPAIMSVVQHRDIPYLFPYAALPELSDSSYKRLFLALPDYDKQLVALTQWAFKRVGAGSAYLSLIQIPGAQKIEAAVKKAVVANGGKFLGATVTNSGTSDYTPLALKIKHAHPDYVILAQSAPDAAQIVKALAANNALPTKRILGMSTLATGAFVNPVANLIKNQQILTVSPIITAKDDGAKECIEAFKEAGEGLKPGGFSLFGCGTAQMLVAALNQIPGEITGAKLADTMSAWENMKASSVFPSMTFKGDRRMGSESIFITAIEQGNLVTEGEQVLQ